jgi:phage terminase large subunit-like protein
LKEVLKYIKSVESGKRNAGELEKLSVERYHRLKANPDYYFDEQAVERVFAVSKLCVHTSGDYMGKQFQLLPWQKFGIACIFGFKHKKTKRRVIRKAYFGIAKKNGKTEFAGFLGLYLTFFDGEKGAEVYSAANKYDQATFCWKAAAVMAKHMSDVSVTFNTYSKIYDSQNTRQIKNLASESFFKPIAKDSKTLDGIKASAGIVDEFHEAKTDEILRNLSSAMVNRSQPLLIIITTAGFNINGPCHNYETVCEEILTEKKTDDTTFILIFRADQEDDWNDEKTWEKANPSLGVTPTLDGLRTEYIKAINEGSSAEISFKTKNLNQWVQSKQIWVKDAILKQGQTDWPLEEMKDRLGFMAIDLSSISDITSIGALYPPDEEAGETKFKFHLENFIPEDNAIKRSRDDGVPYMDWHKEGFISYTPGNWIDYEFVEGRIKQLIQHSAIYSLAYDPWQSENTAQRLIKANVAAEVRPFRQTVTMYNEPIKYLEKMLNEGHVDHRNNKALRWMAGNVVIYRNVSGLMRLDKSSDKAKIDGMVVLAMCVGEYLDYLKSMEEQAYDDYDVRYI